MPHDSVIIRNFDILALVMLCIVLMKLSTSIKCGKVLCGILFCIIRMYIVLYVEVK